MDQRTRMFKALAALALSMTAAASFLAWLEPKDRPSALARAFQNVEAFVRSAVSTAERLEPGAWQGVEIVRADSREAWRRRTLTAIPPDGEHHFRVLESGEVEALAAWREQRFAESKGAIRILVQVGAADLPPHGLQWQSLRTLLIELQTLAARAGNQQPGPWSVTLSDAERPDAALRSLLSSEGFLG